MYNENDILKRHIPSPKEVVEYEQKWNTLVDYVNQENALNRTRKTKKKLDNTGTEGLL